MAPPNLDTIPDEVLLEIHKQVDFGYSYHSALALSMVNRKLHQAIAPDKVCSVKAKRLYLQVIENRPQNCNPHGGRYACFRCLQLLPLNRFARRFMRLTTRQKKAGEEIWGYDSSTRQGYRHPNNFATGILSPSIQPRTCMNCLSKSKQLEHMEAVWGAGWPECKEELHYPCHQCGEAKLEHNRCVWRLQWDPDEGAWLWRMKCTPPESRNRREKDESQDQDEGKDIGQLTPSLSEAQASNNNQEQLSPAILITDRALTIPLEEHEPQVAELLKPWVPDRGDPTNIDQQVRNQHRPLQPKGLVCWTCFTIRSENYFATRKAETCDFLVKPPTDEDMDCWNLCETCKSETGKRDGIVARLRRLEVCDRLECRLQKFSKARNEGKCAGCLKKKDDEWEEKW